MASLAPAVSQPVTRLGKGMNRMDVTLHIGAHRTATSVFQNYLQENEADLASRGIGIIGPKRTRSGMLGGVLPRPGDIRTAAQQLRRARGRIGLTIRDARARGLRHLLISDENMLGTPRHNLRDSRLYRGCGNRLARFDAAFGGRIARVFLTVRAQDRYWASVAAFCVARGARVPDSADLDRLVTSGRHWRDVIRDVAMALPKAQIIVLPYEAHGGLPEYQLSLMTGLATPPKAHAREWMNRAPGLPQLRQVLRDRGVDPGLLPDGEGRWHPFDRMQTMVLREIYADDLFWLRAGADGLATLIEETRPEKMGTTPLQALTERGQHNGIETRRLA